MRLLAALLAWVLFFPSLARAIEDDPNFGPLVEVERIDVVGNSKTNTTLILREVLVKPGDQLRTGDPRFSRSRFRVLALGYFADVKLRIDKGSQPGAVILVVEVVERGTFTLNRLFLGTSGETPIWAGLDVGDSNLFGSGIGLAIGGVWAHAPDIEGGRPQGSLRLRFASERLLGSDFGLHGTALYTVASEAFPVGEDFTALNYRRAGGILGASWDFAPLLRVSADLRYEVVTAPDDVLGGTRILPGRSHVATATFGFESDNRPDPILPYDGHRFAFAFEMGAGDYEFGRALVSYGIWRPLGERHALGLLLSGGLIIGQSPRFDQFYVGDLNPLLSPRALDLLVSTRRSLDVFRTEADKVLVGDLYAGGAVEYAYRLFRGPKTIYGGDLFVSVGAYGLGSRAPFSAPVDLTVNLGLRLDTFIGVFELSLGNALGRLPL
jgi:outer membrane protein insertion porin family